MGYISNSQFDHTGSCNTQVRKCRLVRLGVVQIQVVKRLLKNITIRYQSHRKKFNARKGGYITSELVIHRKHSNSVAVKSCVAIIFTQIATNICFLLFATACFFLFATFYFPLATSYLLVDTTCRLLLATC